MSGFFTGSSYTFLRMRRENIAKTTTNVVKSPKFEITSCEMSDTADNRGCRFWNIFEGKQLHAL